MKLPHVEVDDQVGVIIAIVVGGFCYAGSKQASKQASIQLGLAGDKETMNDE
jgi:hypothetical protein